MKLSTRLKSGKSWLEQASPNTGLDRNTYNSIKSMVHFRLVEQLDLSTITNMQRDALAFSVRESLEAITAAEKVPLNHRERAILISDLINEILGLGPIESLVNDPDIQDILINGPDQVYIEKSGILKNTAIQFRDADHLMQIIDKIVSSVGRRIDESSPMVDARLPDGSRVNVIIPPLALNGPVISIRKFRETPLSEDDLIDSLALTSEMLSFLKAVVHTKLNILISGGTGSGKTTLLNVLSNYIPASERIITIEDSAELQLVQPHVVRLESRPPNIEGKGGITLTDLVKNSLRMRPDRIIVGEARGAEVMDMLQAMNTGHPGSMSTIHANSPSDALSRMEVMSSMGTSFFSERALRGLLASAINIIVQLARLPDGKRRVISISEIHGMKGDDIIVRPVFIFSQKGVDDDGRIYGSFTGIAEEPFFLEHIRTHGMELDSSIFSLDKEVC
ncbi:MAG: CpaF family protein [Deltaproteobacteria bacterium]|nr:CpaF family protein [Deltaproteobacteria bacterium]